MWVKEGKVIVVTVNYVIDNTISIKALHNYSTIILSSAFCIEEDNRQIIN